MVYVPIANYYHLCYSYIKISIDVPCVVKKIEQYINGVIKYIPITNSKRTGLMTETIEK
jgi:hypothetical protein